MSAAEANPLESMVRQVKAEPKKAVALAILVAVLVAMWLKIFVFSEPRVRNVCLGCRIRSGQGERVHHHKQPYEGHP